MRRLTVAMMPWGPAEPWVSGGSYMKSLGIPSQEVVTAVRGVGDFWGEGVADFGVALWVVGVSRGGLESGGCQGRALPRGIGLAAWAEPAGQRDTRAARSGPPTPDRAKARRVKNGKLKIEKWRHAGLG